MGGRGLISYSKYTLIVMPLPLKNVKVAVGIYNLHGDNEFHGTLGERGRHHGTSLIPATPLCCKVGERACVWQGGGTIRGEVPVQLAPSPKKLPSDQISFPF